MDCVVGLMWVGNGHGRKHAVACQWIRGAHVWLGIRRGKSVCVELQRWNGERCRVGDFVFVWWRIHGNSEMVNGKFYELRISWMQILHHTKANLAAIFGGLYWCRGTRPCLPRDISVGFPLYSACVQPMCYFCPIVDFVCAGADLCDLGGLFCWFCWVRFESFILLQMGLYI